MDCKPTQVCCNPAPSELLCSDGRRPAAAEAVEDEVVGIRAHPDDSGQEVLGLLSVVVDLLRVGRTRNLLYVWPPIVDRRALCSQLGVRTLDGRAATLNRSL